MTHMEIPVERRTSGTSLFASGLESIVVMIAAARFQRRTAATRRLLQDLTPAQLNDIGYPEPSVPQIEVKAGLITNLMSMR